MMRKADQKSPALISLTLIIWFGTLYVLGRSLLPIVLGAYGPPQLCTLTIFVALLCLFWLLGSYYIALVILFFLTTRKRNVASQLSPDNLIDLPPIAILYPTCDDFQSEAVLTCVEQEYPNFHVFILDDSLTEQYRRMVDAFAESHGRNVTVVRRSLRRGFKAGNLNHALMGPACDYPLFAVMDADERIPRTFLRQMVTTLLNSGCAFVQANHAPNPDQPGEFAWGLGQTILPFWSVLMKVKNRFGFVPCVGHGVLVRRSAWQAVGGFPEVASEDLALSALLLARGLRGIYADQVLCWEDFPYSMQSFKLQQQRYVPGVLHVLMHYWSPLLRSRKVHWVEKIDFVLGSLPLYIPTICFFYVIACAVGIPLCFGRIGEIITHTSFGIIKIPFLQAFDGRFQSMWTPLFVALSMLISISPALPMLALALAGKIERPLRLLIISNIAYMATILVAITSLIRYGLGQKIKFLPTGARVYLQSIMKTRRFSAERCLEYGFGFLVGSTLIASLNFGLAAAAVCPLLSSFAICNRRRAWVVAIPIFLGIIIQMLIGILFCQTQASPPPLLPSVHF